MNRWKASAIHLAISALVAIAVVAFMLLVWYPAPFFTAMGGNDLVMILIGVDVVLGPVVTLIIFNAKKGRRLLQLDLTVIALMQVAALAYGIYYLAAGRPAYMVFTVDRFDLVAVHELHSAELAKVTNPDFKGIPWGRPRTIAVATPKDQREQMRIFESAMRGADLQTFPQHYVPYEQFTAQALKHSKPVERLRKGHPEEAGYIGRVLKDLGRTEADTRFLPLKAKARDYSVLVDAKSGAVVGFLTIIPW